MAQTWKIKFLCNINENKIKLKKALTAKKKNKDKKECWKQNDAIPCWCHPRWSVFPYSVISYSVVASIFLSLPFSLSLVIQWSTQRMASDKEFFVIIWTNPLKLCKNHKVNELKTFHNVYGDYIVVKRHYFHRHLHASNSNSNSNYFYFLCSVVLCLTHPLFAIAAFAVTHLK